MEELGPDDEWPPHPHPEWRETLTHARSRGWRLTPHSGHSFGTLACEQGVCRITIFSTGKGSENVARTTRQDVERCAHGAAVGDLLSSVDDRLAKAENLVSAAEAMLAKQKAENAIVLLEDADELLEAVWDDFSRLVDEAEIQAQLIEVAFVKAGIEAMSLTTTQVIETASQELRDARRGLQRAPSRAPQVKLRKQRHEELTKRISDVRDALMT